MSDPACIRCAGKGFHWVRGRTGGPRMVKKECPICKGSGKAKVKKDG